MPVHLCSPSMNGLKSIRCMREGKSSLLSPCAYSPALERQAYDRLSMGSILHQIQVNVMLLRARTSMST